MRLKIIGLIIENLVVTLLSSLISLEIIKMFLNKKFHHLGTAFVATGAALLAVIPVAGMAEDNSIEEVLITGTHIAKAPGMTPFMY